MLGDAGLSFARPSALLLLLVLPPLVVYLTRTSLALLRPGRRRFSLALRLTIIALLVLALAGAGIVTASDRLSVVFLMDRSDSVGAGQQAQEADYIRRALAGLRPDDRAGVVVFGDQALVDRGVSPDKSPPDLSSAPGTTHTDIAGAIDLGLAVAPSDTARRLVLLSDGRENIGSAEWAARLAAAHGVPIDVVPLATQSGPEVWVSDLKAPSPVSEGARPTVQVSVSSNVETTATLRMFMDGALLAGQQVSLVPGENDFVQALPPAVKGFHTYQVQVLPRAGSDTRRENNRYSAFSLVLGKPRVLLVEGHPGEAGPLERALATSMDVDVVPANTAPSNVRTLAGYEAVVLVNVPATSIASHTLDALQIAVRDLGRGLVVVGGDESYAAGGYFRTPLEAMLPVDLNLPSKLEIPSVGMALVIDRSGSMAESHDLAGIGVTKLELAKEAASQAVAQLGPRDYVGVITFDSASNWVIPLQSLKDPALFRSRIGGITPGGGTNIYSGLAPAVAALAASNAKTKHVVLLTDGMSEGGDYPGLLKTMEAGNITLSTVAVGADADTGFLRTLADAGHGRFYYTENGNALPQILAHESHLAARSYIVEHPFAPERSAPSPILDGLGGLPGLLGYVGTTPKPAGRTVLVSDAGDPILAQWQYGLGRVVAWTSDARGQWAKDWVAWPDFARFWAQTIGWSAGSESSSLLQSRVDLEQGTGHLVLDAFSPGGGFLNDLSAGAVVVSPDSLTSTVELRQTAPGRYEGTFPAAQEGAYLLQIRATGQDAGYIGQSLGVVVPYSPEYRGGEAGSGLLGRLAALTSGRVLDLADVGAPLQHNLRAVTRSTDLGPLLLLVAILLFPFDVGVRRVVVTRAGLLRLRREVELRLGRSREAVPALAGASGRAVEMQALLAAKDRGRERSLASHGERRQEDRRRADEDSQARDLHPVDPTGRGAPLAQNHEERVEAPPGEAGSQSAASLAARLRRAREQRR